ncbi:hypothetical protein FH608_003695 [Nonomuraea phyllanthi]|uniref:Uncharacterized protein n=1 Tax=Nonomuraea phyllanthi TaxID=2219224 RepID=A0A5C4WVN2_9ACTN|nr:hypothetical protein [Nonomuraea phyllanthi]KAB8197648.1 hypothetical protein FH608_003695 [Nonomuraea phyllanthi]
MTLPPEAVQALQIIGIPATVFPDTERIDRQAELMRGTADGTARAVAGTDATLLQAGEHYRGESGAAMRDRWQEEGGDGERALQVNAAANVMPTALNGVSKVVTAAELAAGAAALYFTYRAALQLLRPDPTAPLRATAELVHGRRRTGTILTEVRQGTGSAIAGAIRRKIVEPLENLLRGMRPPGGPMPAYGGAGVPRAGAPFPSTPQPQAGHRLEMGRGWLGGGSRRHQEAAEEAVQHQVNVNTARTNELEVQQKFAEKAIKDAEARGDTVSADALKQAKAGVDAEHASRKRGRHN